MPARRPAPSAGRCPSDRLTAKAAAAMAVFCSASRRRESDEYRSTLRLIGKHCISNTYRQPGAAVLEQHIWIAAATSCYSGYAWEGLAVVQEVIQDHTSAAAASGDRCMAWQSSSTRLLLLQQQQVSHWLQGPVPTAAADTPTCIVYDNIMCRSSCC
jgi:hypothetical protein